MKYVNQLVVDIEQTMFNTQAPKMVTSLPGHRDLRIPGSAGPINRDVPRRVP